MNQTQLQKSLSPGREASVASPRRSWPASRAAGAVPVLARFLAIWPGDADNASAESGRMLRQLTQALRRERALGRAGHSAYNLARHLGLTQACAGERARLAAAQQQNARPNQGRALKN